ncbi:hypothetical protein B4145_4617 [Bacillus subtilis]|uniref:Uncharacterized protein n=1 Tax=Bacillus subtilis subsp. subtilis TaxID=135461 RepID=A0ABD3ZUC7_BACIU|nr:hypothetical protein B4067_3115 [Bacillus subtilis subsp. subtilis]KIN56893.1 hypothetical protein B4145_4617 [Bacillus subtilis]
MLNHMKKLVDGSTILFFILFVIVFVDKDYNNLDTLDIITMVLALIWLVMTIINIILKWRNLRND